MMRVNIVPDIKNVLRSKTLDDDLHNGALSGLFLASLVWVAITLFCR